MAIDLREHIEKIVTLTDDEYAFVSEQFVVKTAERKEFLFMQGQRVKYIYFVISGLLTMMYNDESGKEHIISFAMEDWWETDYSAFFSGSNATMSLQCLEDTSVLCITLEDYNKLCAGLPKMEHFLLAKANKGYLAAQQRILSLISSNAKQRYEQLLNRYPSLFQRVSRTLLASYLGVSRETLSRLSS